MIDLTAQQARCTIDPRGAWVTRLDRGDDPLLFPRTELAYDEAKKLRGGMHVCLPNFGPDPSGELEQHGFGRTSDWEVVEQGEAHVTLRLKGGSEAYRDLESTLTYALSNTSFSATLRCKNTGSDILRIAPGFHPYFQVDADVHSISADDESYLLAELAGTEFISAEDVTLVMGDRELKLTQANLPEWALWTDQQGSYVCCEPTAGGYRFLYDPNETELLQPDNEKSYTVSISW